MAEDENLTTQVEALSDTAVALLSLIEDIKVLTTERLTGIERELHNTTHQLQQAIVLLTDLALRDEPHK